MQVKEYCALQCRNSAYAAIETIMQPTNPIVVSTWNHGLAANEHALRVVIATTRHLCHTFAHHRLCLMQVLAGGGSALDAAEAGVMVTESDCDEHSVGLSGYPDRDGVVTLDAAIMDCTGRAGSVACVRGIAHPISLARLVMENTPHVMLVGQGAEEFARANGIEVDLSAELHPEARTAWLQWRDTQVRVRLQHCVTERCGVIVVVEFGWQVFNPQPNAENARCALDHDTIGM